MGTIVLLATCLLVVSATPIENVRDYIEISPGTQSEHGSDTPTNGDSATGNGLPTQDTGGHNSGEYVPQTDLSQGSDNNDGHIINNNGGHNTVNNDGHNTDNSDGHSMDSNDEHHADNNDGQSPTSSVNTVSSTSAKSSDEDNADNNSDDRGSPSEGSSNSSEDQGVQNNGDMPKVSDSTVSTTPTEIEVSTQETNGSFNTLPPDGDPEDCRNASKPNHAFLQCTYMCQGDEMLTAPNDAVCFLIPRNGTIGKQITQKYNHTHHNASEIGVCFDGDCISNSTASPATTTESSPVPNTSANIGVETEISTKEQVSVTDTTPSDVSVSFSQSTPQKISSEEKMDNPGKPVAPVGTAELEDVSSTPATDPIALPAALRAMT